MARDSALLEVAARVRHGPEPNLFLAAVHELLLQGRGLDLASYYPTLSGSPALDPSGAPAAFRAFVLFESDGLMPALLERRVQTNEVRRATVLRLALAWLRENRGLDQADLVEVGTSAGLLLAVDRYGYQYGTRCVASEEITSLVVRTELRGNGDVDVVKLPGIAERIGIDLTILNPLDEADRRWLRALIWGDQPERLERLDQAIEVAQRAPIRRLEGDANDLLPDVLSALPEGQPAIVFHSHAQNQFPEAARQRFDWILRDAARIRPVFRISMEGGRLHAECRLFTYQGGDLIAAELLAYYEPHGAWIEWLA